jgi:two-component system, chemotaxis family, CheB/CheR fusion protein
MKTRAKSSKRNKVPKASPVSLPKESATFENGRKKALYIAGIGGSAGSLEAFEEFFRNMPADTGMAFVLVSHLDPTHKALLAELLQRVTAMKVIQVTDGMKVLPNYVYVIPPNFDMSIMHGTLQLLEPSMPRGFRMPIDFFFRHLADDQREKSIGIILSGMGTDGTLGLKAIKEKMGLVMVQDISSAKYDGMPQSAINTGLADFVAPVNELSAKLLSYKNHSPGMTRVLPVAERKTTGALNKIFALLRAKTGNDFSLYKNSTINRRIERRMNIHQIDNINQYVRYLSENSPEIDLLFEELLIGVTSFFREPDSFAVLKDKVISHLLKNKKGKEIIRVWVVGCSTGEEAYSIAIVFSESLDELRIKGDLKIQIYATDLDKEAISVARAGTYPANIAQDVSEERLQRFFTKEDCNYHIRSEIREMIVFAEQNVLADPSFTRLDMLSCRNLLIYLSPETQKKLMPLFHYSLNPGGLLLIGSSESIGGFKDLFSPLDNKWKLFERRENLAAQSLVEFPTTSLSYEDKMHEAETEHRGSSASVIEIAQTNILQTIAPPVVLINDLGDILYLTRQTREYLEPPVGKANMNIYAMAREGLRVDLGVAIRRTKAEKRKVTIEGLRVETNGSGHTINLTVTPFDKPDVMRGLLMVLFEDVAAPAEVAGPASGKSRSTSRQKIILEELEKELQYTKERLQTVIEEMETSQEELKSANEELQSTNEELQSTNEEMVTSKEELQSLNEELTTLNTELQSKNEELSETGDDLKNLLNSTQIATLFLDNNLKIKRFTPYVTKIISLIPSDMGRPITDIVSDLQYGNLAKDANEVLRTLVSRETQVQTNGGSWYLMRIVPYRTTENIIDGVVITFTDITDFKRMGESLAERAEFAEGIISTVREPLVVLNGGLRIVSANPSFYRTFHITPEETKGRTLYDLGNGPWNIPALRKLLEELLPKNTQIEGFLMEHEFPIIGKRRMLLNARRIAQEGSSKELILLAVEDITNHKEQSQISIGGRGNEERTI